MNILVIFGTRPEAIKLAPLIYALKKNTHITVKVCVSGQHREMLDQVLEVFDIVPDIDLDVMKSNQNLYEITSSILLKVGDIFSKEKYDYVIVHGDTTTAMISALAAFYSKVPVLHIEAGLRSNNILSPFPEELNRSLISRIAYWNFSPTESNKLNLINEGIDENKITVTGNTVIDALHLAIKSIGENRQKEEKIHCHISKLLNLDWISKKFILITAHRRENFGEGITEICSALVDLAKEFNNIHFIFPVHLNPNILEPVHRILSGYQNIHLVSPLGYDLFVCLLSKCYLVLTDSGGLQEEAPSVGKPVLVMRDNTERPEALESGAVILVGTNKDVIVKSVRRLLLDEVEYKKVSYLDSPFGNGRASEIISEVIVGFSKSIK